jgi:hypothetical protein
MKTPVVTARVPATVTGRAESGTESELIDCDKSRLYTEKKKKITTPS